MSPLGGGMGFGRPGGAEMEKGLWFWWGWGFGVWPGGFGAPPAGAIFLRWHGGGDLERVLDVGREWGIDWGMA